MQVFLGDDAVHLTTSFFQTPLVCYQRAITLRQKRWNIFFVIVIISVFLFSSLFIYILISYILHFFFISGSVFVNIAPNLVDYLYNNIYIYCAGIKKVY